MKRIYVRIIFFFFFLLFLLSAYMIVSQWSDSRKQEQAFDELINIVEHQRTDNLQQEEQPDGKKQEENGQMQNGYEILHEQNPDLFGWIEVKDTSLNYPVMHTPDDPDYYLRRAFDKTNSQSGVPFLDGACFVGCGNYLIYGHNMKNGSMFAAVLSYAKEEFWKEHPVIRFDTLYETGSYEVLAAFYSKVYEQEDTDVFRYYRYTDLREQDVFYDYIEQAKAAALYETGVAAEYGDQILTLSTCSYHTENGRFVVIARKTEENQFSSVP